MDYLLRVLQNIKNKKKLKLTIILVFIVAIVFTIIALKNSNDNPFIYFAF
jgi:hypothetical protein